MDLHTKEVINKSFLSTLVKASSVIVSLVVSIYLGRSVGADELGAIDLTNRLFLIIVMFSMLGMDNVLVKNIAIANAKNDEKRIFEIFRSARLLNYPLSSVLSLLMILLAPMVAAYLFRNEQMVWPLIVVFMTLLPQAVTRINVGIITGLRKIWQGNMFNETVTIWFVGLSLVVYNYLYGAPSILHVIILYSVGRVLASITSSIYLKKVKPRRNIQNVSSHTRSMLSTGVPLFAISAVTLIVSNLSPIFLSTLSTSANVGLFSVAARLALLMAFLLLMTNSAISPKLASLYENGEISEIQGLIQRISSLLIIMGIGFLVTYIVFGDFILGIWGNEFREAYWVLVILSIGQLINISTGSTGVLLIMSGHERILTVFTITFFVVIAIITYLAILNWGLLGAAFATALGLFLDNLAKWILVRKFIGVNSIPSPKFFRRTVLEFYSTLKIFFQR